MSQIIFGEDFLAGFLVILEFFSLILPILGFMWVYLVI